MKFCLRTEIKEWPDSEILEGVFRISRDTGEVRGKYGRYAGEQRAYIPIRSL
jgi:hypothetical protein